MRCRSRRTRTRRGSPSRRQGRPPRARVYAPPGRRDPRPIIARMISDRSSFRDCPSLVTTACWIFARIACQTPVCRLSSTAGNHVDDHFHPDVLPRGGESRIGTAVRRQPRARSRTSPRWEVCALAPWPHSKPDEGDSQGRLFSWHKATSTATGIQGDAQLEENLVRNRGPA